jgi:hypothetical protein
VQQFIDERTGKRPLGRVELAWLLDQTPDDPGVATAPLLAGHLLLSRPWVLRHDRRDPDPGPEPASPRSDVLRTLVQLVDEGEAALRRRRMEYLGAVAETRARFEEREDANQDDNDAANDPLPGTRRPLVMGFYAMCVTFDRLACLLRALDVHLMRDGQSSTSPLLPKWRRKMFETPSHEFVRLRNHWDQKERIELMRGS